MRTPILADVAARAEVSIATVSRVLNDSRPVRPEIAARVRAAADQLGYSGNSIARALRNRRTDTVGMVVPSVLNPFFTSLIDSMENALQTADKQLLLCDSRQDPHIEATHLRALTDRHVDGIVVSPCHITESSAALVRTAALVPLVQLDRRIDLPDVDWVGLDDPAGLRLLVDHLRSSGARRLAFVTSEMTNSSTADRLRGFREHTAAAGLTTRESWILLGDYSVATGEAAAHELLRADAADRPDAIVCADDLIAIGVLRGCQALGIRVPHDVRVAGIDDIEFASYVTPALTTLRQPTERMASEALRLLDQRALEPGDTGVNVSLTPSLVVRGSTTAKGTSIVRPTTATPPAQGPTGSPEAPPDRAVTTGHHRGRLLPLPADPRRHVAERYEIIARADRDEAWIDLRSRDEVTADVIEAVERAAAGADLPLAGALVAVKGNIDVHGLPTTAGCPAFAYRPEQDATAVARLRAAGAVVLGTTNLDQFATGLVGTRSPYGAVRHAVDADRISGGSSSGSAVAVAIGAADLALGTDTAGSGRVPAAFHGLHGVKPTRGWVPAGGVVPACRSLDVVTAMAGDLELAVAAVEIMAGPDERDPLSRVAPAPPLTLVGPARIGIPHAGQLGELAPGWTEAFERRAEAFGDSGARLVPVDIEPFLETALLLYEGAFVAERYTAVGGFIDTHPGDVDPTVRDIIAAARDLPAWRLFGDQERLDRARTTAREVFTSIDALLLPTTTWHPSLAAVEADPVGVNSDLGRFTNFANLLDLAAIAAPGGEVDGLPFGVQLVAPAFADRMIADILRRHG